MLTDLHNKRRPWCCLYNCQQIKAAIINRQTFRHNVFGWTDGQGLKQKKKGKVWSDDRMRACSQRMKHVWAQRKETYQNLFPVVRYLNKIPYKALCMTHVQFLRPFPSCHNLTDFKRNADKKMCLVWAFWNFNSVYFWDILKTGEDKAIWGLVSEVLYNFIM